MNFDLAMFTSSPHQSANQYFPMMLASFAALRAVVVALQGGALPEDTFEPALSRHNAILSACESRIRAVRTLRS